MRKAQDPPNNSAQGTPAYFSQLKYNREQKQKAMYDAHMQTMQARVNFRYLLCNGGFLKY